jgi:hypothetical protein
MSRKLIASCPHHRSVYTSARYRGWYAHGYLAYLYIVCAVCSSSWSAVFDDCVRSWHTSNTYEFYLLPDEYNSFPTLKVQVSRDFRPMWFDNEGNCKSCSNQIAPSFGVSLTRRIIAIEFDLVSVIVDMCVIPHDHLLLDSAPNLGWLVSH